MIQIKFKKLNENARIPTKATIGSAGFDLYATKKGVIHPNEIEKIPLGFATNIPDGYFAFIRVRSGLASKFGIHESTSGVIDSDYTGEWLLPLINLGEAPFKYDVGDRIAQVVILPVILASFTEVNELEVTSRGNGGFGSTGSK